MSELVPIERIEEKILLMRGQKVMLDKDLARLYGVETKVLVQAVKRSIERFPEDFMFQLTKEELGEILRSQFVTSSWGGRRYLPYAFTEQGVAMLSSVLNSKRAISVNIQIIRVFTKLRRMAMDYVELKGKIEEIERKYEKHDQQFKVVFDAIKRLLATPVKEIKVIGFKKKAIKVG
ncbi:MAG: ORF6N domain-containing protein [Candidatus Desantisbacteria bacterium]